MGSCLSKKDCSSSSSPPAAATSSATQKPKEKLEPDTKVGDESLVKKEIFVIKHRKSRDKRPSEESGKDSVSSDGMKSKPKPKSGDESEVAAGAETSTAKVNEAAPAPPAAHAPASKEEEVDVDAILIQCGRLSRSSSGTGNVGSRRNYSGSKRSYDFDAHNDVPIMADGMRNANHYSDDEDELRRHRQSRPSPSASARRRRRTPSREREGEKDERSSSRERGSNGNGSSNGGRRRVSRSPGRRSSEVTTATANATVSTTNGGKPGKMVSVPATVSSLVMDKSNISEAQVNSNSNANAVKRISVKRNVGDSGPVGPRGTASPRSQSPAAARGGSNNNNKENQQQQVPSLSRNNSRKAEQSPYRRNPLSEIDNNTICNSKANSRIASKNKEMELQEVQKERESMNASMNQKHMADASNERFASQQGNGCRTTSVKDLQQKVVAEEHRGQEAIAVAAVSTPIASGGLTRSSSSRLSGPGLEPEVPVKPISYTSLLLEDIHNFHQKNAAASVPIPACVTKACSIYEAVAELNSKKTPNVSNAQMETRLDHVSNQYGTNEINCSSNEDFVKKKRLQSRDPFVESELSVGDDLMEPTLSIHKYVTMHRGGGTLGADDKEERESSGSNSFVGGGLQQWGLSSTWEPGSADSSECWTSHSNNNTKGRDQRNERSTTPESGNFTDNAARKLNGRRRDVALQPKVVAGRGRI